MEEQSGEDICQGCSKNYDDDVPEEQAGWLGCDTCWCWWHYSCAGYDEVPDTDEIFSCPVCLTHHPQ